MKRFIWVGSAIIAMVFFVIGCTKTSTGPSAVSPSDNQQITDLTTNEYADYFSFEDLAEGDAYGSDFTDELDSVIRPTRWGRVVNSMTYTRTVTVDTPNTDTARVTVTNRIQGVMKIGYTDSTGTHVINKPFTDVYQKRGVFFRRAHTANRALNWRLVRVSGIEGQTDGNTAVNIASVSWYRKPRNGGSWGNWAQVGATVIDPVNFWQVADSIPSYTGGDSIRVDVTMNGVNTPNAWYGQFQYRPHGQFSLETRTPFDTLGNNQFRVMGRIPLVQTSVLRRAFIDFMTWNTLHDDILTDYAANVWGLLYKVN